MTRSLGLGAILHLPSSRPHARTFFIGIGAVLVLAWFVAGCGGGKGSDVRGPSSVALPSPSASAVVRLQSRLFGGPECLAGGASMPIAATPPVMPTPPASIDPDEGSLVLPASAASWPTTATNTQAGLTLELHLPMETYVMGEAVTAVLVLTDQTGSTLDVRPYALVPSTRAGDGQDIRPSPRLDPLYSATGEPGYDDFGPGQSDGGPHTFPYDPSAGTPLGTGQSIRRSASVQLPFENSGVGPSYTVTATASLVGSDLTAGIGLHLVPPAAQQHLQIGWAADRRVWCVGVTDSLGQMPGPGVQGGLRVASGPDVTTVPLLPDQGPVWTGTWNADLEQGTGPLSVDLWIAGPGYVTTFAQESVPS